MGAQHLRDLAVFRLCEELMIRVEAETSKDPLARHFRFRDQLADAALDAASDVAEGFVRYYPGEFARFLDFAISSLQEVHTRTEAAYRRKLLSLCARADTACRNLRAYLWKVRKSQGSGHRVPRQGCTHDVHRVPPTEFRPRSSGDEVRVTKSGRRSRATEFGPRGSGQGAWGQGVHCRGSGLWIHRVPAGISSPGSGTLWRENSVNSCNVNPVEELRSVDPVNEPREGTP